MNLPFTTELLGQKNYFLEKIWVGLIEKKLGSLTELQDFAKKHIDKFGDVWDYTRDQDIFEPIIPKYHTIRKSYLLFKPGMKLHMVINNRTKSRFQFAPVLTVQSIQEIEISLEKRGETWWQAVFVDGKMLNENEIYELAMNDGFKTIKDFFSYFCNGYTKPKSEFKGGIIHWADLNY